VTMPRAASESDLVVLAEPRRAYPLPIGQNLSGAVAQLVTRVNQADGRLTSLSSDTPSEFRCQLPISAAIH
jgi:hypothetical protein